MKVLKNVVLFVLLFFSGIGQAETEIPDVFRLKNRYYQSYLHTENSRPELKKDIPSAWWSARWTLERVPNTKYYRIKCLWKNTYLHTERDNASIVANVNPAWYSAMWEIEELTGTNFVRLKSRHKRYYLTTINGFPNITSNIPRSAKTAHWRIESLNQFQQNLDCIIETVSANTIRNLCPSTLGGHLKSGNRNLDSKVETSVHVNLSTDSYKINAQIILSLKATKNTTKVNAVWNRTLYTAPRNKAIRQLNVNNTVARIEQTLPEGGSEFISCNDGDKHRLSFNKNSFIDHAIVIGDTGAEDISNDGDCNCDARLDTLVFRDFEICLQDREAYDQWVKDNPTIIQ